jgi:hypothetical protein
MSKPGVQRPPQLKSNIRTRFIGDQFPRLTA